MDVLFPFGYVLSYTTFEYSDLQLDKTEMKDTDTLTVSVKVKNTGSVKGKEIVQLYVGMPNSKTIRPDKELKGFEKIYLEPGESRTVRFDITPELMSHYNSYLQFVAESGEFIVSIGPDSLTKNSASFFLN